VFSVGIIEAGMGMQVIVPPLRGDACKPGIPGWLAGDCAYIYMCELIRMSVRDRIFVNLVHFVGLKILLHQDKQYGNVMSYQIFRDRLRKVVVRPHYSYKIVKFCIRIVSSHRA
jgi:hypothetical protein